MTYRVQVNTHSDAEGVWTGNAVTYETADEATEDAKDLFGRWTAVKLWRVIDSDQIVVNTNEPFDSIAENTEKP